MQTGIIGVTTENIFPIIKKFLYSDHEIFLRELISNAIDATKKLKALSSLGDFTGELGDLTIRVSLNKKKKTLTVSDRGIGMTSEEVEKYINQIAFSSAEDFLNKYKNQENNLIGHFGLGFYSSFMVSDKVEIITRSYQDNSVAVKWSCDGSPEYQLEETTRDDRGTDVILHFDSESKEFNDENKIEQILKKYCKFLPFEIAFGKEKEWKDGKEISTDKDKIINNTKPAWTRKPADLKDEDYKSFYHELYPSIFEEPLFYIHLNVDYPFSLTGILYFPKIKSNFDIQKNKIQLYCNQVFVTDSVEGIVPEFLTLLHGVIDSPDIPLNVSRSYLQSDSNVKKISNHITKKVADRLAEIFKNDRPEFEKKWDDLKLFIEYGIITDEKFYEKAKAFCLLKNTDNKYFTFDEYETLVKENQTDKNKRVIYLYCTDPVGQHTYVESAKSKGYDVLHMSGQLDPHFINYFEQKLKETSFVRVDSNVIDKLIEKTDQKNINISLELQNDLTPAIQGQLPTTSSFIIQYEPMDEHEVPMMITQNEWMRRMKEMSATGGGMGFYRDMPENYNLVVNTNHPLVQEMIRSIDENMKEKISGIKEDIRKLEVEKTALENSHKDLKYEEITQADKDKLEELRNNIQSLNKQKENKLSEYGKENKLFRQLIDLALLADGMLKGEELTRFVKRSVEMIKA
ncbi:MAG: molecular chaperone HtpG [Bacteroidia bacterium]|nr:molecular chaperone HtpG [Bacteroidia bacterium]